MNLKSSSLRRTLSHLVLVFMTGCIATLSLFSIRYVLATNVTDAKNDLLHADAFEPYLVKDISPGTEGSSPSQLTVVSNTLFFFADDWLHGREPWKSDGTEAGTMLAGEVVSGAMSANASELTAVGDTLYFIHRDTPVDWSPRTLWKTGGTPQTTISVTPLYLPYWIDDFLLTDLDGTLYFRAGSGGELWKSDGTPTGTVMIKDLALGAVAPDISSLMTFQGKVYAVANGILWQSDGTPTGTVLIKSLFPTTRVVNQTVGRSSGSYVVSDDALFFGICTSDRECALWKTDGTVTGTVSLKGFTPGSPYLFPSQLTMVNGLLFFSACHYTIGCELWKSDGTVDGTVLIKDINPGAADTPLSDLTAISDKLYFSACDSSYGCEMWISDGTESGTVLVSDIAPGAASSDPADIVHFNGQAFFVADDGISGRELWTSTGTLGSTILFRDVLTGPVGSQPTELTVISNTLFFRANDGFYGQELWKTDGSSAGTTLVRDIRTRPAGSVPSLGASAGSTFLFWADDGTHGRTLWRSDATVTSTLPVAAIQQPYLPIFSKFTTFKGAAFFGVNSRLWRSDGTPEGTLPIRMFISGMSADPVPYYLTVVNNRLFFAANDSDTGTELFVSDGTTTGTIKIIHLTPDNLVGLGDKLYFTTSYYGSKLWESDGTLSATQVITALPSAPWPGTSIGSNNLFYMIINSQVWRSDGTSLGTFPVGVQCGYPYDVYATSFANGLYFTTDQDDCGFALWLTDGSMQGTSKVWTAQPELRGTTQYGIEYLATLGDEVYFTAYDDDYGRELWKSDGTLTGTVRVADIYPGAAGSAPSDFFIAIDKLYFSADDGIHGRELWQSDGTPEGTFMVADICSGPCSSSPTNLSLWNTPWQSTLFFQADDGVHGAELWALRLAEYGWHHNLPMMTKQR